MQELERIDAAELVHRHAAVSFCFLDGGKEIYEPCWDIISDHTVPGGIVVIDNTISRRDELIATMERACSDDRFDTVEVPVHMGELVCRRRDSRGPFAGGIGGETSTTSASSAVGRRA